MAGDWIKMRVDLCDDPAVIQIAAITGLDEDTVVGKLHKLWAWADGQTADGHVSGVTESWIDRYVSVPGFAQAMQAGDGRKPWLVMQECGILFPGFEKHNGSSAKRRAQAQLRQRRKRDKDRDGGVTEPLPDRDKNVTREEKRREEVTTTPPVEDHLHKGAMALLQESGPHIGLDGKSYGWFGRLCQTYGYEECMAALRELVAKGKVFEDADQAQAYLGGTVVRRAKEVEVEAKKGVPVWEQELPKL